MQRSDNYKLVTFISIIELHDQWGPRLTKSIHRGVLLGSQVFMALALLGY
jgi:hypothetical protein